ncbi:transcriptional regulator [Cryptosporangium sp. NPDC048952]|uniref:transcriptional regulator n=1 Tax=Cryptosporangium sp. NPDC048952 TaxID=3363961 RepID=UPI00371A6573
MSGVLHVLRCVGGSGLAGVADAAGVAEDEAESALIDLAVAGLVTFERGEFGGWRITAEGKAADDKAVADELDALGARAAVQVAYQAFLELNPELLDLCTAWQLRTAEVGRVVERLGDLHARCSVVLEPLVPLLPRFERHRAGLRDALSHAEKGQLEYLTDRLDSYHTRWFRLHEDLLVTLGTPRH